MLEDEYDKVYAVSKDQEKLLRELRNQLEAERRVGKEVEEGREERSQMVNRCCGEDRVRESIADKRCGNCEKRCCERRCCEREFI